MKKRSIRDDLSPILYLVSSCVEIRSPWRGLGRKFEEVLWSVCLHMEGRSGDVVVAPLDEDDVGAPFLNDVVDGVLAVPPVFDDHLFAGGLRTVHPHVQDVVAGAGAVHSETAISKSTYYGVFFFLFSDGVLHHSLYFLLPSSQF